MNFSVVPITLFLIAGIFVGVYLPLIWPKVFLFSILICFSLSILFKRSVWQFALIGLSVFFIGLFLAQRTLHVFPENHLSHLKIESNEAFFLRGVVCESPSQNEFKTSAGKRLFKTKVPLEVTAVQQSGVWKEATGKVLLELFFFSRAQQWEIGEEIEAPVRLRAFGQTSFGDYMRRQRILFAASVTSVKKIHELGMTEHYRLKRAFARSRHFLEQKLAYGLEKSDYRQILMGLVFGTRGSFSPHLKELLLQTNTYHIMAISGFNMALVILILTSLFTALGLPYKWVAFLMSGVILVYMALVGWPPSATRAGIMSLVFLMGWALDREVLSLNTIAISALIILLISPMQLFMPGFQLSYMVVLGLVFWATPLQGQLKKWVGLDRCELSSWKAKLGSSVTLAFSVSLIAWLVVLPIILCFFGTFSLYSVLTNVLIALVVSLLTGLGLAALMINLISVNIGIYLNQANTVLMDGLLMILRFFHQLPGAFWQFPKQSEWWLVGYYFIMLYFLYSKMQQKD